MGSELGVTADSKPHPSYTPVNIWWACWACVWTIAIVCGISYLVVHRNAPILRIRGLGLSLSAIIFLHLYWATIQFGEMIGALLPGDAEYWIMGTYLPCGIALFHASNSHFLHVAKYQKKYAHHDTQRINSPRNRKGKGGLINRFRSLDYSKRVLILVAFAMLIQLFLTVLMWLISRKWHSSWGIPGTEVHGTVMEQKSEMGRGWEWWPGVFSQFFWSWVVAPIILWKSRNIHDTQGWRAQTIGCAIAGLPATPMWLIALYVPAMEPVAQYWLPPQWICLSILIIEIFTVFLPCWEVMHHQSLRQETLDAIAQWESRTKGAGSESKSLASTATMVESLMSGWKSTSNTIQSNSSSNSGRESILNMSALEYVLERNPTPLQQFSALNDFSGENIAFLTSVVAWKNSLPRVLRGSDGGSSSSANSNKSANSNRSNRDENTSELIRQSFNRALNIYVEFISVHHAEFPINISSQDLKRLEQVFETPARILYGDEAVNETDPATPFAAPTGFSFGAPPSPTSTTGSERPIRMDTFGISSRAQYVGEIPGGFDAAIFDDAEKSIKYLVLTNTWAKFVKRRRASTDSDETLKPGMDV